MQVGKVVYLVEEALAVVRQKLQEAKLDKLGVVERRYDALPIL